MKGIKLIRLSQFLSVSFLILVLTTFASGQTQKTQGTQEPEQPVVEVLNIIDAINQGKIVEDAGIDITKKNIYNNFYKKKRAAIRGLGSSEKEIQTISMRFLGIEDTKKDRIEVLIPFLKDKDYKVRREVAEVLGEIKDPRAVEPLISALKDEDSGVRGAAAYALKQITSQNFGVNQEKRRTWWK